MDEFKIVFEDQWLWVIDKSAGLLSQSDHTKVPSLVDLLKPLATHQFVGIVQRLDRNTSGLMVVAKTQKIAEALNEQIHSRTLKREYVALAKGAWVGEETQTWVDHLIKDESKNQSFVTDATTTKAQRAELSVTCVRAMMLGSQALVECRFSLQTGRSHQIRVQASHKGHPLLGDPKYGKGLSVERHYQIQRPMLHSLKLAFTHPTTHKPLNFESALPADMTRIFKMCS